jgi:hypothetical protein
MSAKKKAAKKKPGTAELVENLFPPVSERLG